MKTFTEDQLKQICDHNELNQLVLEEFDKLGIKATPVTYILGFNIDIGQDYFKDNPTKSLSEIYENAKLKLNLSEHL